MIKFSKLILSGTLLFGTISVPQLVNPPEASAYGYDDWGYNTVSEANELMTSLSFSTLLKDNYYLGDTFRLVEEGITPHPGNQVKIFKIESDGSLSRYKTINPEISYAPSGSPLHEWKTTFTSGFTPGEYMAIIKLEPGNSLGSIMKTKTFKYHG